MVGFSRSKIWEKVLQICKVSRNFAGLKIDFPTGKGSRRAPRNVISPILIQGSISASCFCGTVKATPCLINDQVSYSV